MRNTLLDSLVGWDAYREGHIPFWKLTENGQMLEGHTGDIKFLVEIANKNLRKDNLSKKSYVPDLEIFGNALSVWFGRFIENGFTTEMLQELRKELGKIRFFHGLNPAIPSRGKPLPHWVFSADTEDFIDPRTTAAYAFANQLTLDGLGKLKLCQINDCQKFFIGRPQAKWCSKACGSRFRVGQKRKKDKIRYS